jgi:hypothetical protein
MSNPEDTEPYTGDAFIPPEFYEIIGQESILGQNEIIGARLDEDQPMVALDTTVLDIDITNTDN